MVVAYHIGNKLISACTQPPPSCPAEYSRMKIVKLSALLALITSAGSALATPCGITGFPACPVPEPGMLGLVGVALAAAVYLGRRGK
jgi:hypothetical protein